ncbi:MAG: nucleotidyltransferase family protein, partial [Oceanobacter sp.]
MSFHSRLRPIQGRPGIHSALAITSSIVSPWMSGEQVERVLEAFEPDWERIFALAAGALLSPVLWERINEKNLTARIPKDFLMALQVIHEANCERNRQHKMVLLDAVRELNRLGIEPVLLKGAHALAGLEPDQDARILSDIDLIIPDGRAREAQNHLISMGYYDQPLHEGKWHPEEYDGHQMEPLFHPTLPAYLELHHYPHWKEYSENLVNYILSDLQPMELEGCHMKV